jgi:hypothetical protein
LDREDGAGLGASAIDEDRARAALAGIAADVSSGEMKVLTQEVHEQHAGFHRCPTHFAIDCD